LDLREVERGRGMSNNNEMLTAREKVLRGGLLTPVIGVGRDRGWEAQSKGQEQEEADKEPVGTDSV
jgi:hypothetical protein